MNGGASRVGADRGIPILYSVQRWGNGEKLPQKWEKYIDYDAKTSEIVTRVFKDASAQSCGLDYVTRERIDTQVLG